MREKRKIKKIESYIFEPEEAQSSGCIHEVSSYKRNEQGSNKSKFKENSENEEHKNELQNDEVNRTESKSPVNSTKEILWNHRSSASQEDGPVKCAAKFDVAVNGGNSCAEHSMLNPNTNPVKETGEKGTSSHSEASSAKHKNNAIELPDIDYPQNGNQTENNVEKDSFSVNCAHSDQNTGSSAIQALDLCVTPPLTVKESSIEPFKTDSASWGESLTGGITTVAVAKIAQAPTHTNHKDVNGEMEEEDAEVAAALAALEAATAGEDLEDDDEY
uniref:Chromosome 4 open reading frame 19 n=1 Tax=Malurus cyaneus samueli TaxID=2593467 RepID=A0A8C5T4D6_9PASS